MLLREKCAEEKTEGKKERGEEAKKGGTHANL